MDCLSRKNGAISLLLCCQSENIKIKCEEQLIIFGLNMTTIPRRIAADHPNSTLEENVKMNPSIVVVKSKRLALICTLKLYGSFYVKEEKKNSVLLLALGHRIVFENHSKKSHFYNVASEASYVQFRSKDNNLVISTPAINSGDFNATTKSGDFNATAKSGDFNASLTKPK